MEDLLVAMEASAYRCAIHAAMTDMVCKKKWRQDHNSDCWGGKRNASHLYYVPRYVYKFVVTPDYQAQHATSAY